MHPIICYVPGFCRWLLMRCDYYYVYNIPRLYSYRTHIMYNVNINIFIQGLKAGYFLTVSLLNKTQSRGEWVSDCSGGRCCRDGGALCTPVAITTPVSVLSTTGWGRYTHDQLQHSIPANSYSHLLLTQFCRYSDKWQQARGWQDT